MTSEAQRFPSFQLRMGARVEELIEEGGQVPPLRSPDCGAEGSLRSQNVAMRAGAVDAKASLKSGRRGVPGVRYRAHDGWHEVRVERFVEVW